MYEKTFNVDDKLFQEAKASCGARTDTETVRLGLEALVRQAAYERLRAFLGLEPDAEDVRGAVRGHGQNAKRVA